MYSVHYSTQYSHFFPFPWPPPLCRWQSALLLFPLTQLWLKYFSPSKRSSTDRLSLHEWLQIFLLLTHLRMNSCLSDTKTNLPKYITPHLTPFTLCSKSRLHFWRTWPSQTKLQLYPKPVIYHICQLRCIRHYLGSSTACTIDTSIVHSKLDYCNSLSTIDPISLNYPTSAPLESLIYWRYTR